MATTRNRSGVSLSNDEIATIVEWVDGGSPKGPRAAPQPPRFSEAGWSHPSGREPDFIYEFPIEWQVDADGETPNFNLFTPLPFNEEIRVEATEVLLEAGAVTRINLLAVVGLADGCG